jgi:hypothetical protein
VNKLYRCQRFTSSQLKRPKLGSNRELKASRKTPWSGAPDCPVAHRTVSGAPGGLALNSSASGFSWSRHAIIHRTVRCTPDSVRCSKEGTAPELASLGNSRRLLRYNSPDMSGVHRTVRCILGATATSRQRLPATAFNARAARAEVRIAHAGAPPVNSACPVRHQTSRRAQKSELQRSISNGTDDVAGAPDMSSVHRTVRCAIEQTASTNGQVGGWGYKYPNHPTIHGIQVFTFQPPYKS